jgi:hypothetical protein
VTRLGRIDQLKTGEWGMYMTDTYSILLVRVLLPYWTIEWNVVERLVKVQHPQHHYSQFMSKDMVPSPLLTKSV